MSPGAVLYFIGSCFFAAPACSICCRPTSRAKPVRASTRVMFTGSQRSLPSRRNRGCACAWEEGARRAGSTLGQEARSRARGRRGRSWRGGLRALPPEHTHTGAILPLGGSLWQSLVRRKAGFHNSRKRQAGGGPRQGQQGWQPEQQAQQPLPQRGTKQSRLATLPTNTALLTGGRRRPQRAPMGSSSRSRHKT